MKISWHRFAPIVIATIVLLQGCAGTAGAQGVAAASDPDRGTIVIRPTFQGIKYASSFSLLARRADAKSEDVSLRSWSIASDGYWTRYYDDIERGELVVMPLPAGDYEIHGWSLAAGGWGGTRTSIAKDRFAFQFRVQPGKAVYLGNLHLTVTGDVGGAGTYNATASMRDTRARDLAELPKLAPELAPDRVDIRPLR